MQENIAKREKVQKKKLLRRLAPYRLQRFKQEKKKASAGFGGRQHNLAFIVFLTLNSSI